MLELAERLGRLASCLADGAVGRVQVFYAGEAEQALRPLTVSAMGGVVSTAVGRSTVNFVNALHLASSRGIAVEQVRAPAHGDYAEYVEVRVTAAGGEARVAGALLA